jgi:hypothetical protein
MGVADGGAAPVGALYERAAPGSDDRRVLGKLGGKLLALQLYPSLRATIRRSDRSWATRIRAIAARTSPPS